MATYFDQISKSYTQVPIDDNKGIEVSSFLEATENLIKMFDLLNGTAFGPVKSDMQGNVTKIRTKFQENPTQFKTLQDIVLSEKSVKKKTATEGLLWLRRGLDFTCQSLRRSVTDPAEELNTSFSKAYDVTLSKHHSFLVRPIFSMAMKACPYRKDFYAKLGADLEKVVAQLKEWLSAIEAILKILDEFYASGGYEKGPFS